MCNVYNHFLNDKVIVELIWRKREGLKLLGDGPVTQGPKETTISKKESWSGDSWWIFSNYPGPVFSLKSPSGPCPVLSLPLVTYRFYTGLLYTEPQLMALGNRKASCFAHAWGEVSGDVSSEQELRATGDRNLCSWALGEAFGPVTNSGITSTT